MRMTWKQIKHKYPHQNVGLTDVRYGKNEATVASGTVVCTDKDMSYYDMLDLALDGKIVMRYTTIDEDDPDDMTVAATIPVP